MKRLYSSIASIALVLLLSSGASAFALIDGGQMGFNYAEFPSGAYGGTFQADGPLISGISLGGGTSAVLFEFEGVYFAVVIAGLIDGGGKVDGAVVVMQSPTPFVAGVYPIDPIAGTIMFAFIDDAVAFAIPADPSSTDWPAWFDQLTATRKFIGASGAITLTEIGVHKIRGTFSGLTVEITDNTPVAVSGGSFSVLGGSLPVEASSWANVKGAYHD